MIAPNGDNNGGYQAVPRPLPMPQPSKDVQRMRGKDKARSTARHSMTLHRGCENPSVCISSRLTHCWKPRPVAHVRSLSPSPLILRFYDYTITSLRVQPTANLDFFFGSLQTLRRPDHPHPCTHTRLRTLYHHQNLTPKSDEYVSNQSQANKGGGRLFCNMNNQNMTEREHS